jgi:hypothetical protein
MNSAIKARTNTKSFVIDGLTRTGSTTLAAVLNCHPDITCLVEPFHPRRYGGHFHRMAVAEQSVQAALDLIWCRWTGIKHVWESNGWPFTTNAGLNDQVVLGGGRVIFLQRRNLLRRCISGFLSRELRFWIGTREEFNARLEEVQLKDISLDVIADQMKRDQIAVERRLRFLRDHNVETMSLFYEDLYAQNMTNRQQLAIINDVLTFLGFSRMTEEEAGVEWQRLLDPDTYRWSSPDVYRMIPGIGHIEDRLGCDETGWVFK